MFHNRTKINMFKLNKINIILIIDKHRMKNPAQWAYLSPYYIHGTSGNHYDSQIHGMMCQKDRLYVQQPK